MAKGFLPTVKVNFFHCKTITMMMVMFRKILKIM